MWTKRHGKYFAACLLSGLLFCLPMPRGFCSATYEITEQELTTLETNLSELADYNARLRQLLTESATDLTIAGSESETLRTELTEARRRLNELQAQLATLRSEAASANESLTRANAELTKAAQSLRESEAEHAKTEAALRNQRTGWQVLSIVLAIFAGVK